MSSSNFKGAYRDNAIADLLLSFAKKHMPEELANIEAEYNEIYEKRHQRIEERKALLAKDTESEPTEPEAEDAPEEEIVPEAEPTTEEAKKRSFKETWRRKRDPITRSLIN